MLTNAVVLARGSDNAGHTGGATAGIIIGVIVVVAVLGALAAFAKRR